jgi:hypothetical protein
MKSFFTLFCVFYSVNIIFSITLKGGVIMVELDKETKNKIRFITFIIPEFAEAYKVDKS